MQHVLTVATPPDEAFRYVADFANLPEWDPSIASANKLGEAPVGEGTAFEVVATFRGRAVPMEYRITVHDPPRRVVLAGEGATVAAVDDIRFAPEAGGTRITYQANLTLRGAARWAGPLLRPAFRRLAAKSMQGLETALGVLPSQRPRSEG